MFFYIVFKNNAGGGGGGKYGRIFLYRIYLPVLRYKVNTMKLGSIIVQHGFLLPQGSVVQNIVSLTSSLMTNSLTVVIRCFQMH